MTATALLAHPLFWAIGAVVVPLIGLIAAAIKSLHKYLTKNRVDRLQMYVSLVDDLQEELRRLRSELQDERKEHGERVRELSTIMERMTMENEALRRLLYQSGKSE